MRCGGQPIVALLTAISLGAGVQSTAVALMAKHGLIEPMPDCAIFADTGWEPKAVYAHLGWLEAQLPFPVKRVAQGNLKEAVTKGGFSAVPFYTENGLGARQCTYQYKIRPLYAEVRRQLADGGVVVPKKGACEMWVGISTDEIIRMKDARVQYVANRFPLIELRMSRNDCLKWLERNGYARPPRSACLGCPFKRDSEWRQTKAGPADEWLETIEADKQIRLASGKPQFMHRSLKPLDEVDLSTAADHGQQEFGFLSECEGMCGI